MKEQNNPIQSIISEIDEVLNQSSTRNSPKVLEETLRKSQKILRQIVDYLDQDLKQIANQQSLSVGPLAPENASDPIVQENGQPIEEVLVPISSYLQEDFAILRQQRQALQEEIRQLEKQKQDEYFLAKQYAKQEQDQIISEFSQGLLSSEQETLVENLSQSSGQHLSQSALPSSKNFSSQTNNQIETSEVRKKSEDQLEENIQFEQPFFDDSNIDDREKKQQNQENNIETNVTPQYPQINRLNDSNDRVILPYPGYEFSERVDTESNTKETETTFIQADNSNFQESSIPDKSSIAEQVNLETVQNQNLENETSPQLEAPIFAENDQKLQNNQNKTDRIEDETVDIIPLPLTPKSKLEESENRENLDNTEILQSLSNLFGNLEFNQAETNQLTPESEEEIYIHALGTENLLPIQEVDEKQKRELLLDTNSLDNLRSDLENLEQIDLDELIDDDPEQTQLQLGEYEAVDLNQNTPNTPNEEFTHLEDLFANMGDISEKSTRSNQDNIYSSTENTENELNLENILDSLASPEDPEITETDNQEILSLETLLQESLKSEKKNH